MTDQEVKPCKFVGGACVNCDATERGDCQGFVCNTYTPREWVGLTDEDLEFWTGELGQGELGRGVIRAVADHLKERNNG